MYCLKMINLVDFFDIIYPGTIPHFVQCFSLIGINKKKGYGKELLEYWEKDMKSQGYDFVLTSTQVDETAQHFYRKLGYKDCGGLIIDIPNYEQPMEMFLIKAI